MNNDISNLLPIQPTQPTQRNYMKGYIPYANFDYEHQPYIKRFGNTEVFDRRRIQNPVYQPPVQAKK